MKGQNTMVFVQIIGKLSLNYPQNLTLSGALQTTAYVFLNLLLCLLSEGKLNSGTCLTI